MNMDKDEYYVVALWRDNTASLIGLQSRTEQRSRECIAWQKDGSFDAKYHVCRYDTKRRDFVCIDTLVPYVADRGPFTQSAWAEFMGNLNK